MSRFLITGRRPLRGTFTPTGNKNAALPMLAACVLTDEPVTLHNLPLIQDVEVMLLLLDQLNVSISRHGRSVTLCAKSLRNRKLDRELCRRVRASILLAGPLAARHGRALLFPPGGDGIGRRRIDTHIQGFRSLGIATEFGDSYSFRRRSLAAADILLDEASVTATENILMAAALAPGESVIFNAACEPHVQDLALLLSKMGAQLDGIGTNRIRITGATELRGAEHAIGPDYIELGSYLAAAAATGGALDIPEVEDRFDAQRVVNRTFKQLGVGTRTLRIRRDVGSAIPKIEDGAWPAFPSDLMSVAIVLATQARGSALFFEKMFESRMYFVDRLIEMGAHIVQCDPHRVVVQGPSRLHAIHMTSPDIRAGMALLIAALCSIGRSIIDNAEMIDRGYEDVVTRLRALGADIERDA